MKSLPFTARFYRACVRKTYVLFFPQMFCSVKSFFGCFFFSKCFFLKKFFSLEKKGGKRSQRDLVSFLVLFSTFKKKKEFALFCFFFSQKVHKQLSGCFFGKEKKREKEKKKTRFVSLSFLFLFYFFFCKSLFFPSQ
jgi:hypothetical protein